MAAPQFKLDNIIAFTDYNKMQIDGLIKDIMDLGAIEDKWKSFGWFTQRVDGHNFDELSEAIDIARVQKGAPSIDNLRYRQG